MNLLELFLGQIPEAVFLALFMIFSKGIKIKRVEFIIYIIVEYLFVKYTFRYSYYFHVLLMILIFLALKLIYKEKSQITDIFILIIAYFYLGFSSVICYYLCFNNVVIAALLNRLALFLPLLLFNYKLNGIQKLYKKQWNRGNPEAKIKSTTFRSLNLVLFNIAFVLIHAGMIFGIIHNRGGV